MPIAAPPGATIESAVDAWVIASACRKRRPGSATIHGGANVARFSAVAPASTTHPLPRERRDDGPDITVVRDPRQDDGERDDDDRGADTGERVAAPAGPLLLAELGCAVRGLDAAHDATLPAPAAVDRAADADIVSADGDDGQRVDDLGRSSDLAGDAVVPHQVVRRHARPLRPAPRRSDRLGVDLSYGLIGAALVAGIAITIVVGWVHRFFTQYTITTKRLNIRSGVLSKTESSTNVDRIQNITVKQSPSTGS